MALIFDVPFYMEQNPDVLAAFQADSYGLTEARFALHHYNNYGWKEGRDPNATFDTALYAAQRPDVVAAVNAGSFESPFQHYLMFGSGEGFAPNASFVEPAQFDEEAYFAAHSDVAMAVARGDFASGYQHYVLYGQGEGRAAQTIDGVVIDPGSSTPGNTFTLTLGLDNLTGTSGNDIFVGVLNEYDVYYGDTSTFDIYGGDVIDGGAGYDILQISQRYEDDDLYFDNVTNVEELRYQTFDEDELYMDGFSDIEKITLYRSDETGNDFYNVQNTVDVEFENNTGWTDLNIEVADAAAEADTEVTVTITDNNDEGADLEMYTVSGDDFVTVYNVVANGDNTDAELELESTMATVTVNVSGASDELDLTIKDTDELTTVNASAFGGALTLSALTAQQDITVTGGSGDDSLDVTARPSTGASDEAITFVAGGAGDDTVSVTSAAGLQTMTAEGGDGDDTITVNTFNATADGSTATITGGAGEDNISVTGDTNVVVDVDAGADNDTITLTAIAAINANAGAGDDSVTMGNAFALNADSDAFIQVLDGGDGTDTFEIDTDNLVTSQALLNADVTDFSAAIMNFERLSLTAFDTQDIDGTTLGFNDITIDGYTTGGSLTVEDAATVVVTGTGTIDAAIIVDGAATGTQSLNLTVNGADGIALNDLTVADVETINIVSSASAPHATTPSANTVDLIAAAATTLNISGATELVFGATANLAKVATVAAGDFDAGLTLDLTTSGEATTVTVGDGDNDITGSAQVDTITAGDGDNTIDGADGNDVITTGAGFDTIIGGAGNDTISSGNGGSEITGGAGKDTITLGSGATADDIDTIIYTVVTDSQGVNVDVINGFQANVQATTDTNSDDIVDAIDIINDVIDLSGIVLGTATYAGEANGYGAVLTSLTGDMTNSQAVLDTSTSTLYVDRNADGILDSNDMAIQLTGVTDLSADNFAFV